MGQQRENHAADEEHNGIGYFETLGEGRQPRDEQHEQEKCELEVVNAYGLHGALSREFQINPEKSAPLEEGPF